jgi:probable rRNA maturation factor
VSHELSVRNCQTRRKVDLRLFESVVRKGLQELETDFEIGIRIVSNPQITRVNERYLRHSGPTDVITFDYSSQTAPSSRRKPPRRAIVGDIYISMDEAVLQADRFGTSWRHELVRYAIHGILHLLGFDDGTAAERKKMKKAEDDLVSRVADFLPASSRKTARRHG